MFGDGLALGFVVVGELGSDEVRWFVEVDCGRYERMLR